MTSSQKDRREVGYGLVFLVIGLLLGIEGNFVVSFWMKAVDTGYSLEWVVYSVVLLLVLVILSYSLWRKATNLISNPKIGARREGQSVIEKRSVRCEEFDGKEEGATF